MNFTNEELITAVRKQDLRAIARLITLSENRVPRAREVQAKLFESSGNAHVVGVTGAPGAGKSTLVDQMALALRKKGKKVAILAVDPTSPFSGGAVLGDRVRMVNAAEYSDVYIRSMATRGSLGGLSNATLDAIHILDAAKFDFILVETVGVGQAEVDIVRTADTCVVVMVPGMGDHVQAIKAGVLEIADAFVINKSDREGADLLFKDLRILTSLSDHSETSWIPPIVKTVAVKGEGTSELLEKVAEHGIWLGKSEEGKRRKHQILRDRVLKLARDVLYERLLNIGEQRINELVAQCVSKKSDPYTVVDALLSELSLPN